jgi:hypothetical protein
MKSVSPIAIVFAAATLLYAQNTKAAPDTTAFDGTWSVMVDYREYKNPDGTVALPWVIHCQAEVKDGVLHAEHGTKEGTASWELNGKIAADGTATLTTTGITGNPKYTPFHPEPGKRYKFQVIAHFERRRGTGKSVGDPRTRTFAFVKD